MKNNSDFIFKLKRIINKTWFLWTWLLIIFSSYMALEPSFLIGFSIFFKIVIFFTLAYVLSTIFEYTGLYESKFQDLYPNLYKRLTKGLIKIIHANERVAQNNNVIKSFSILYLLNLKDKYKLIRLKMAFFFLATIFFKVVFYNFDTKVIYILCLLYLVLLYLHEFFIGYRVVKGIFGTNKYEAKELINFIKNNADDSFNDKTGKPIPIFEAYDNKKEDKVNHINGEVI